MSVFVSVVYYVVVLNNRSATTPCSPLVLVYNPGQGTVVGLAQGCRHMLRRYVAIKVSRSRLKSKTSLGCFTRDTLYASAVNVASIPPDLVSLFLSHS